MGRLAVKLKNSQQKKIFSENELNLNEQENYYPNETTIKAIEEAEKGIGMSRTYNTIEELMEDLMKDD